MDEFRKIWVSLLNKYKYYILITFYFNRHPTPYGEADPTLSVNWEPLEPNSMDVNYLDITARLESKVNPEPHRLKFWDDMYQIYNGKLLSHS